MLIDLGTNGELLLKGERDYFATSCATGPAFEGAAIEHGIQAIPGASDKVSLNSQFAPFISIIPDEQGYTTRPKGVCGSGILSAIAAFIESGVIEANGAFSKALPTGVVSDTTPKRFILHSEGTKDEVAITQKDIRQVQLGKAALMSGIEFLLKAANIDSPTKIIVAGAFGSHLDPHDLTTLGMIPAIPPSAVEIAGNAAGAGALMVLCDSAYLDQAKAIASRTKVINLAEKIAFQNHFVKRLSFTSWSHPSV